MLMEDASESLGVGDQPKHSHCHVEGLSTQDVQDRMRIVGPNVMEVPPPSFFNILLAEIAHPFYIYQVYIVWVWVLIDYFYATMCIWALVLMTGLIVSWFRYRGVQVLYAISRTPDVLATVIRNGLFQSIHHMYLVPGDIVQVHPGKIHCDMVLLTGECVLDESALTGEATPQAKTPIDPDSCQEYDPKVHKKVTLSAGTEILECEEALALVVKTASSTAKGELIREVLVFRDHQIKFRSEIPVAVALLATYGAILFFIVLFSSSDERIVGWVLAS